MSSYDRRLLYQQFFGTERRDSISPMNLDDELPFVTRESVREAMGRRNEYAVWHTTGLNPNVIRPEDYITNDYMTDFASSLSTELERLAEKIRVGEFNLEPKPSKKTLSNPQLSLKEGTDDA